MSPRSTDDHTHRGESQLAPDAAELDVEPASSMPDRIAGNADQAAVAERARAQRAGKSADEAPAREPRQFVGDLPPLAPPPEAKSISTADGPDAPPSAAPVAPPAEDGDPPPASPGSWSALAAPAPEEIPPPPAPSWLRQP